MKRTLPTKRPRVEKQTEIPHRIRSAEFPQTVVCFENQGVFSAGVFCSQEIAFEIIQRNLNGLIRDKHGLISASFIGHAFLIKSENEEALTHATAELRREIQKYTPDPRQNIIENTGTARDLKKVRFTKKLKHSGETECIFCCLPFELGQKVRRTPCLHLFHAECIEPWLLIKKVCPVDKMALKG